MISRHTLLALAFAAACGAAASPISRIPLPRGFHPHSIAVADFTGDGHSDIALCGEQFLLLAGDGRGGFRPIAQTAECGAHPMAMTAADLDGDGRMDIAVANHDTDHLTVLHNEGGGRFAASTVHVHSVPHPHTVAAADVNGDGHVDLITDSWQENRLTLVLADGRGGWQTPGVTLDTGLGPYINIVAADLDGDGKIDLIMPNARPDDPHDRITILFGDGHGHFQQATQSPLVAGTRPFMIEVADVNGDGRPDIVVTNYSGHITDTAGDGLTWVRNDGGRRFTAFPERAAIGRGCWRVATGDLNGDRFADAAFINAADNSVSVAYGSPNGFRPGPTIPVMREPHNLAIGERRLFVTTDDLDEVWVIPLSSK